MSARRTLSLQGARPRSLIADMAERAEAPEEGTENPAEGPAAGSAEAAAPPAPEPAPDTPRGRQPRTGKEPRPPAGGRGTAALTGLRSRGGGEATDARYAEDRERKTWHVSVPHALYWRYADMIQQLEREQRFKTSLREVTEALLWQGPENVVELHELVADHKPLAGDFESAVWHAQVRRTLYWRYADTIQHLARDQRQKVSLREVTEALLESGPRTAAELREAVERWRGVAEVAA